MKKHLLALSIIAMFPITSCNFSAKNDPYKVPAGGVKQDLKTEEGMQALSRLVSGVNETLHDEESFKAAQIHSELKDSHIDYYQDVYQQGFGYQSDYVYYKLIDTVDVKLDDLNFDLKAGYNGFSRSFNDYKAYLELKKFGFDASYDYHHEVRAEGYNREFEDGQEVIPTVDEEGTLAAKDCELGLYLSDSNVYLNAKNKNTRKLIDDAFDLVGGGEGVTNSVKVIFDGILDETKGLLKVDLSSFNEFIDGLLIDVVFEEEEPLLDEESLEEILTGVGAMADLIGLELYTYEDGGYFISLSIDKEHVLAAIPTVMDAFEIEEEYDAITTIFDEMISDGAYIKAAVAIDNNFRFESFALQSELDLSTNFTTLEESKEECEMFEIYYEEYTYRLSEKIDFVLELDYDAEFKMPSFDKYSESATLKPIIEQIDLSDLGF